MGYDPSALSEKEIGTTSRLHIQCWNNKKVSKLYKSDSHKDYEKAKEEYERESGGKKLTRRNKATLSFINDLEKVKLHNISQHGVVIPVPPFFS